MVDELGLFGAKLVDAVAGESGERVAKDAAGTLEADSELVADRIEGHTGAAQLHEPCAPFGLLLGLSAVWL